MTEESKTKSEGQIILDHLDSHIRSWRQNFTHPELRLRQRGIDAVDALQQFRLMVFGALLPQDDGSYRVFTQHGEISHTVESEAEAKTIYNEDSRHD